MNTQNSKKEFDSFKAFYPFYLSEHQNSTSRRLHVMGTTGVLLILLFAILSQRWTLLLLLLPILGYGFAWAGHYIFEKNRPATFKHPLYSLMGDFVMWRDVVTQRLPW
jgi:hypothetical protein